MHVSIFGAGALACISGVFLATAGQVSVDAEEASLTPSTPKDWEYLIPDEEWFAVRGPIFIGTHEFATEADGETKVLVATTSGSKPKAGVNVSGDILKLKATNEDGSTFNYAIRVRGAAAGGFEWAPAGIRTGTVSGQKVTLFDRNANGVFNDIGQDAISVGKGIGAALLGRVLMLGSDQLVEFEVAADGSSLRYSPYQGETGVIDIASEFALKATLDTAIFTTTSGDLSFDLADTPKGGVRVPVGTYQLTYGRVTKGSGYASIGRGKMASLPVSAESGALLEWGSDLEGQPIVRRGGSEVTITPEFRIYGRGGEEYHAFSPDPAPQRWEISDTETDKRLKKGSLPTG